MSVSIRTIQLFLIAVSFSTVAIAAESIPSVEPQPPPTLKAAPATDIPAPQSQPVTSQKPGESITLPKQMRLGYIDLMRISNESDPGKKGQKQLEDKKKKLQSQLESKRKQLEKMKSDIEAKIQTMPPQQREAKAREFQKKVEEFQKFGQSSEGELQKLQQELLTGIYEKIEKACAEYAGPNGLSLVVVKRELLYLDTGVETVDVTDGVIKLLNGKESKK